MAGVEIGVLIAEAISEDLLQRLFGCLMVVVAAQVAWRTLADAPIMMSSANDGVDDTPGVRGERGRCARASCLSAAAPSRTVKTKGSAQAYAIRILVPNAPVGGTEQVVAPPDGVSVGGAFAYPADGSVVTTASATARVSTSETSAARATASAEVADLSLFGGEVTAELVTARAGARASTRGARAIRAAQASSDSPCWASLAAEPGAGRARRLGARGPPRAARGAGDRPRWQRVGRSSSGSRCRSG